MYFNYCTGLTMTNDKFADLFGQPVRGREEDLLEQFHGAALGAGHLQATAPRQIERPAALEHQRRIVVEFDRLGFGVVSLEVQGKPMRLSSGEGHPRGRSSLQTTVDQHLGTRRFRRKPNADHSKRWWLRPGCQRAGVRSGRQPESLGLSDFDSTA